ncbi:type II toxin-antitoxin system RelB family antitoxin [Salinisphaera hydrothermalis]|uniref:Relaxosome protein TraY n=1 Tax=Salinisphaera hydrothermalis (strain C41B8) TaxID=1304275 RepID=A0A084IML2_SALHC|nr:TraY domain-containing protein [Salinisphaera hydrothermalis]KEZ77946.1 CopG family DNA-binding protein, antitoxin [Salinisphaera hydrothermalis C41B8]
MINFRADDELDARLTRLAQLTGRTKTFYVRQAVESQLDDLEDIYLADQVMSRVDDKSEATYNLDDIERDLGLAD